MKDFRRDTNIRPVPGTIVAEFACGSEALEFASSKGYTVTAGINHPFAVRVKQCEELLAQLNTALGSW